MKNARILFFGLIFMMSNCLDASVDKEEASDCSVFDNIHSKEKAQALILGEWDWIKTTYPRRGVGVVTETPAHTEKVLIYKFLNNKVQILEDNDLIEELLYEIKFWGEDSNNIEAEILTVRFFKLTGEFQGTSMLFMSSSCLTLVNSYNDVGGDLTFKRI